MLEKIDKEISALENTKQNLLEQLENTTSPELASTMAPIYFVPIEILAYIFELGQPIKHSERIKYSVATSKICTGSLWSSLTIHKRLSIHSLRL